MNLKGIINISGTVGIGKTAMALESGFPIERIKMLNWDVKHPGVKFPEENYHSFMHHQFTGTELDMCIEAHKIFQGIQEGDYDVLILDSWESFVATIIPYVIKNEKKLKTHFFGAGEWKQRQVYGYGKVYEAAVLSHLQSLVPLIFVINHLDYMYVDKVRTEKKIPKTSDTLRKKSQARFYLQENHRNGHPCPSALVFKQLPNRVWNPDNHRIESRNVLPPRLDVECLEGWEDKQYISVWDIIEYYWENPVLNRVLKSYEIPDENETSIIYETLTPDERDALDHARQMAMLAEQTGLARKVRTMAEEGSSAMKIAIALKNSGYQIDTEGVKSILAVSEDDEE